MHKISVNLAKSLHKVTMDNRLNNNTASMELIAEKHSRSIGDADIVPPSAPCPAVTFWHQTQPTVHNTDSQNILWWS